MQVLNSSNTSSGAWKHSKPITVNCFAIIGTIGSLTTTFLSPQDLRAIESNCQTSSGQDVQNIEMFATKTIKDLRNLSGLTWDQLAKIFSVSRRSVHHWDSGSPMNSINQKKLNRVISLLENINFDTPAANRNFLLSSITGEIPVELLANEQYEKFLQLADIIMVPRETRQLAAEEKAARQPFSPEVLISSRSERKHTEVIRKKKVKIRKKNKA